MNNEIVCLFVCVCVCVWNFKNNSPVYNSTQSKENQNQKGK
jgi:hypothetical protein